MVMELEAKIFIITIVAIVAIIVIVLRTSKHGYPKHGYSR